MRYVIMFAMLIISFALVYGLSWALDQPPAETAAWIALGYTISILSRQLDEAR